MSLLRIAGTLILRSFSVVLIFPEHNRWKSFAAGGEFHWLSVDYGPGFPTNKCTAHSLWGRPSTRFVARTHRKQNEICVLLCRWPVTAAIVLLGQGQQVRPRKRSCEDYALRLMAIRCFRAPASLSHKILHRKLDPPFLNEIRSHDDLALQAERCVRGSIPFDFNNHEVLKKIPVHGRCTHVYRSFDDRIPRGIIVHRNVPPDRDAWQKCDPGRTNVYLEPDDPLIIRKVQSRNRNRHNLALSSHTGQNSQRNKCKNDVRLFH